MLTRREFWASASILYAQKPGMFADAEAYERFMGRWSRLVAPILVQFADVPNGGRILDVGSGTGALAFAAAQSKSQASVLGIDPSKQYVDYASSQNHFPDRVSFETGDAQQLRFDAATFDACLSLFVFNFIPDHSKALKELRRVTKPGGRIAAAVWDYGSGMKMLRTFWDAAVSVDPAAEKLDERHMPLCRSGELSKLWRDGGLEKVHEQSLAIPTRFQSFADYWDAFMLGQGPAGSYVKTLTPDKVRALRLELERRLAPTGQQKPLDMTASVRAVRGTVT